MPRLRKYHVNKSVLFITTSVEQGLMLNANRLCKLIISTALARAQKLHPVRICHFLVEATHIHMLVIVDNPNDIKDFMERFKTETATRLNRILGRKKRTIWCRGYDSCLVQTIEKVKDVIAYIYSNPAKDNLEDSIDSYPGLSSWKMIKSSKLSKVIKYIRRPAFKRITADSFNLPGFEREADRLQKATKITHTFYIYPNAWMEAFDIDDEAEINTINDDIVKFVRGLEAQYREERRKSRKTVFGKENLNKQLIDTSYMSVKQGKRMWCISSDVELRKKLINHIKDLVEQAKEVYQQWKFGDYSIPFPLGLYPPSMPKIAEPIMAW